MSKLAFNRNLWPIGGYCNPGRLEACGLAGQMKAFRVCGAVKRRACVISPLATSSYLTNPGSIGSPAASADVQFTGRRALELRVKIAPDPACHVPSGWGYAE